MIVLSARKKTFATIADWTPWVSQMNGITA